MALTISISADYGSPTCSQIAKYTMKNEVINYIQLRYKKDSIVSPYSVIFNVFYLLEST